jgi:hypothetical protein
VAIGTANVSSQGQAGLTFVGIAAGSPQLHSSIRRRDELRFRYFERSDGHRQVSCLTRPRGGRGARPNVGSRDSNRIRNNGRFLPPASAPHLRHP